MERQKRIFGLETEHIPLYLDGKGEDHSTELASILQRSQSPPCSLSRLLLTMVKGLSDQNIPYRFFDPKSGVLFYDDMGHLEIATPECRDPMEVVAWNSGAREFLTELLVRLRALSPSQETLTLASVGGGFEVAELRRRFLSSRGSHESYLIRPEEKHHKLGYWLVKYGSELASFMVSRQFVCGNESVFSGDFTLSQRTPFIEEDVNGALTTGRGILNTKDDPLSNTGFRLHLASGDSNVSDWSIFLKFALTGIVIAMLEDGFLKEKRSGIAVLGNKVKALHEACADISGKKIIMETGIEDGPKRRVSTLDHLIAFYEIMREYFRHTPAVWWEKKALKMFRFVLEHLENDNAIALSDKLDWAIKKRCMDEYMRSRNIKSYADHRVQAIDFRYHDLSPAHNVFKKLDGAGRIAHLISPETIAHARNNTPTTRAAWRSTIFRALQKRLKELDPHNTTKIRQDWESLQIETFLEEKCIRVDCLDPFADNLREILAPQIRQIESLTKEDLLPISKRASAEPE